MSRFPKAAPGRVSSVKDAQRATDQLAESLNRINDQFEHNPFINGVFLRDIPYEVGVPLEIPHGLDRPITGIVCTNGPRVSLSTQQRNPRVARIAVEPWYLRYHYKPTVAESSFTLNGINGDRDLIYRVDFKLVDATGTDTVYTVSPNGSATSSGDQDQLVWSAATATAADLGTNSWTFYKLVGTTGYGFGSVLIDAKSGNDRALVAVGTDIQSANTRGQVMASCNNDDTVKFSSLKFEATTGGFGIGTEIFVYAYAPAPKTLDLWVF